MLGRDPGDWFLTVLVGSALGMSDCGRGFFRLLLSHRRITSHQAESTRRCPARSHFSLYSLSDADFGRKHRIGLLRRYFS